VKFCMVKKISIFKSKSTKGNKTSVGLDIGSYAVKMVEISEVRGDISLVNYVIKELPAEARGREKRTSPLRIQTVKDVLSQCSKIPDQVTLVFSDPSAAIKRMTLPVMPESEIESAIRWEGKKQFTFPLEDATIIFQGRGEKEEEGIKKIDLLVAAAQKGKIQEEISALDEILPAVSGIDLAPFALQYSYRQSGQSTQDEAVALIHMGAEETSISIIKDNHLQFTREIYIAGNHITQVLTEPFTAEGKLFTLSLERAEAIKREYGIPLKEMQKKTEEGIPLSRIMFIIRPFLERLLTETIHFFDFYKTQLKEKGVNRIFISGGCAKMKNLKEYLTDGLGIEVTLLDPFQNIPLEISSDRVADLQAAKPGLPLALGLAIGKAWEVNLLPPQPKFLETIELQRYALYLFPLLFLSLLLSFYYRIDRSYRLYQGELLSIKAALSSFSVPIDKIESLRKEKADIEKEFAFLPSPYFQAHYPEVLKLINGLGITNLCLEKLALEMQEVTVEVKPPAGAGKRIRLEGIVFGSDPERLTTLATIIEALEKSPLFETITLVSTGENRGFNQSATDFVLLCSLSPLPS